MPVGTGNVISGIIFAFIVSLSLARVQYFNPPLPSPPLLTLPPPSDATSGCKESQFYSLPFGRVLTSPKTLFD